MITYQRSSTRTPIEQAMPQWQTNLIRIGLTAGALVIMDASTPAITECFVVIGYVPTYGGSYMFLSSDRGVVTISLRDIEHWVSMDVLKVVVL